MLTMNHATLVIEIQQIMYNGAGSISFFKASQINIKHYKHLAPRKQKFDL